MNVLKTGYLFRIDPVCSCQHEKMTSRGIPINNEYLR
eukprot:COSAG02_NODE_55166_length_292_cov_0.668394_1_plen_36_part_10